MGRRGGWLVGMTLITTMTAAYYPPTMGDIRVGHCQSERSHKRRARSLGGAPNVAKLDTRGAPVAILCRLWCQLWRRCCGGWRFVGWFISSRLLKHMTLHFSVFRNHGRVRGNGSDIIQNCGIRFILCSYWVVSCDITHPRLYFND